jgi:hypothetical protein
MIARVARRVPAPQDHDDVCPPSQLHNQICQLHPTFNHNSHLFKIDPDLFKPIDHSFYTHQHGRRNTKRPPQKGVQHGTAHAGELPQRWGICPRVSNCRQLTYFAGQLGRVAVIGGSEDYTGAPYFSAMASAKLGCDMVCIFTTCKHIGSLRKD